MEIKDLKAYKVLKDEVVPGLDERVVLLEHRKTGAQLALMPNEEKRKVFTIAFRTPPSDSSGVAHVVEHSVMQGSRKYPIKDLFSELSKKSIAKYLNALTSSDLTRYIVESSNLKDFKINMDVFLDAVFYPNYINDERIFRQEGWRYEMDDNGEISVNGVVYSEMRGRNSVFKSLMDGLVESLYGGTAFENIPGGRPEEICKLSLEDCVRFYKRYYHPSNSFTVLAGDMDYCERLEYIDREYFSAFEKKEIILENMTPDISRIKKVVHKYYDDAEGNGETVITFNYRLDLSDYREQKLYISILMMLFSKYENPLNTRLVESGLAKAVKSVPIMLNGVVFRIEVDGVTTDDIELIDNIVRESIEEMLETGLDINYIDSFLSSSDLNERAVNLITKSKGSKFASTMFGTSRWIYGNDTINDCFNMHYLMRELLKDENRKEKIKEKIRKYLLENEFRSIVVARPESKRKDISEKLEYDTEKPLTFTNEEKDIIREEWRMMEAYLNEKASEEQLALIPAITLKDVDAKITQFKNEIKELAGIKTLYHEYKTEELVLMDMHFNINDLPDRLIQYIPILILAFNDLRTKFRSRDDFDKELMELCHGPSYKTELYTMESDKTKLLSYLNVSISTMPEKLERVIECIGENLFDIDFYDETGLRNSLIESRMEFQHTILISESELAEYRAGSGLARRDYLEEKTKGISYYRFLSDICDNFDSCKDEVVAALEEIRRYIFRKENLFISVTTDSFDIVKNAEPKFEELIQRFYTDEIKKEEREGFLTKGNEAFITGNKVANLCVSAKAESLNYSHRGFLRVLGHIIRNEYFWNEIRIKGGAYGCGGYLYGDNSALFCSDNDPNIKNTYKVIRELPDYIENYDADEKTMEGHIFSALSTYDNEMTVVEKGDVATACYIRGLSDEARQEELDEVLSVNPQDIRNLAPYIRDLLANSKLVVCGSEEMIRDNEELFENIEYLS